MNKAQQMMIFLAQLIENDKELDLVSDGIDGGLDFHFDDCSRINIKEVNDKSLRIQRIERLREEYFDLFGYEKDFNETIIYKLKQINGDE